MKTKITIVGRGLDPAKHLSVAAIRALRAADIALGIEPETEAWKTLRAEFGLPEIQDIGNLYKPGAVDRDNYAAFLDKVAATAKQHAHVVLLVAGHPRLGVTFAQMLSRPDSPLHAEIEFIEGLSSFDILTNDLALDPLEQGTSLIDCNRMLLFEYDLEPAMNHFLYHVCSIATQAVNFDDPAKGNRLDRLEKHLLKFYRPDKELLLCRASNGANQPARQIRLRLDELTQNLDKIDFATTAFIPAELPSKLDSEVLRLLQESAHV